MKRSLEIADLVSSPSVKKQLLPEHIHGDIGTGRKNKRLMVSPSDMESKRKRSSLYDVPRDSSTQEASPIASCEVPTAVSVVVKVTKVKTDKRDARGRSDYSSLIPRARKFEKPRLIAGLEQRRTEVVPGSSPCRTVRCDFPNRSNLPLPQLHEIMPSSTANTISVNSSSEILSYTISYSSRFLMFMISCLLVIGICYFQCRDQMQSIASRSVHNLSRSRAIEGLIIGKENVHDAISGSSVMKLESELNGIASEIAKREFLLEVYPQDTSPLFHSSGNYLNPFELVDIFYDDNFNSWNIFNGTSLGIDDVVDHLVDLTWKSNISDTSNETHDILYPGTNSKSIVSIAAKPLKRLKVSNIEVLQKLLPIARSDQKSDVKRDFVLTSNSQLSKQIESLDIEYSAPHWGATIFDVRAINSSTVDIMAAPYTSPAVIKGSRVSWVKYAGFKSIREASDPNIVLSQHDPKIGECFAIPGNKGAITVEFPRPIIPTSFQLQHVNDDHGYSVNKKLDKNNFANGIVPVNFTVYGWTGIPTLTGPFFNRRISAGRRIDLGSFQYDFAKLLRGETLQTFPLIVMSKHDASTGVRAITFYVRSNNGNKQFTCLYRMKVLGGRVLMKADERS